MNKDYIAQNLCVNKDKPWLHCNGKCFLMRKIAEAEKKQQNEERKIQRDLQQPLIIEKEFKVVFAKQPIKRIKSINNKFYLPLFTFSIFHPPQLV